MSDILDKNIVGVWTPFDRSNPEQRPSKDGYFLIQTKGGVMYYTYWVNKTLMFDQENIMRVKVVAFCKVNKFKE